MWNGNNFKGKEAVLKFFEDLPTSEHKIDSLDVQPIPGTTIMFFTIVILPLIINLCMHLNNPFMYTSFLFAAKLCGGHQSMLVKTYGTVKFPNNSSKTFYQTFILSSQNNVWKIVSDTFRFQDKSDA